MKQIEIWEKQYQTIDKTKGGYSDVRLWPCYMAYSGLVLFLAPIIGLGLAIIIVTASSAIIAIKLEEIHSRNPVAVAAQIKAVDDLYTSISEREEIARIESMKLAKEVSINTPETSAPENAIGFTA